MLLSDKSVAGRGRTFCAETIFLGSFCAGTDPTPKYSPHYLRQHIIPRHGTTARQAAGGGRCD